MILKNEINSFSSGSHTLISDEVIPKDAASSAVGWLTQNGRIELMYGRQAQGGEGVSGKIYGEHTGYRVDGTAVRFRKAGTKIQYLNGSTWVDVITGLTVGDVTFANYYSLAGAFVYITDPVDGLYKICTANPADYTSLYFSTNNFKGYSVIDQGRMFMWGVKTDKTGLYGSRIDAQNSTVYTTITGEATTSLGGTLAFKAGGARRTCFGLLLTITASGETYADNYNGVLTGSLGGTGTINYTTGVYTVTNAGVGTVNYQWEDSSVKGVTDFTKSATRLAGEGFIERQDLGGDSIKSVIPFDGSYFSMKARSIYQFTLDAADTSPTNRIFRTGIGVSTLRSAVATSTGIVYVDTGHATNPRMSIVQRNPVGDNFLTAELFSHFDFSQFTYTDVVVDTWDKFVVVGCQYGGADNNRILLCNVPDKTIDVAPYGIRAFTKNAGVLYGGDPLSLTSYELFTGFDDMSTKVTNEWISANDTFGYQALKKSKKLRFRGRIDPSQSIQVYLSVDNSAWQRVGTIVGSGDYVDYNSSYALGTTYIGQDTIGGGLTTTIYNFLMEIKIRVEKFRKRRIKFVATGYGYCSIQQMTDWDIWTYADVIPRTSRITQNVSLDGLTTDQSSPSY